MHLYDYKLEPPFVYMSNLQLVYGVRMYIKNRKQNLKEIQLKLVFIWEYILSYFEPKSYQIKNKTFYIAHG